MTAEADLRRLRARLAVSAAATPESADPTQLLADELAFLEKLSRATSPDPRPTLVALWRELRLRATALAADLPPGDASRELLEEQLRRDALR